MMRVDPVAELNIIEQLRDQAGGRLRSHDLCLTLLSMYGDISGDPQKNSVAQMFLRIAIKAKPYLRDMPDLIKEYRRKTLEIVRVEMPGVVELIERCERSELPLPVIMSCHRYLDRARPLVRKLQSHYFGLEPLLIVGGASAGEYRFSDGVLHLPVDDNYEGLPEKVFEAYTFIDSIGARFGVLKIDDDVMIRDRVTLNLAEVRSAFRRADYMGVPISTPQHDRSYHLGKCAKYVSPVYGKPFLAPFAAGCLYFLSKKSLSNLAEHYLRFPGCISGEIYEDKAVADVLHNYNINVLKFFIEEVLQIDTDLNE